MYHGDRSLDTYENYSSMANQINVSELDYQNLDNLIEENKQNILKEIERMNKEDE